MIVRELLTRLGFQLDSKPLEQADRGVQRIKTSADGAIDSLRNMVGAFAAFATVRQLVTIADEMQSLRTRIGQLPQTVGDVAAAFDAVGDRASANGLKLEAYGTLYSRLGHAAKDYVTTQEDLLSITDTISQALVVGGATTQEASATMIQFAQALGSGVLQGDEFRSMAEAAPQYLDQLSKAMGYPREQLKQMASDGKLTSKAVIEATRQMSGYFSEKFKEMPMTVGRSISAIGNRFAKMLDKMNRDSGAIPRIANLMLAAFDKIEAGVNFVVKAFGGWGNMFQAIGTVAAVVLGGKLISILMAVRAAGFAAALPFIKLIAIVLAVAAVLEDLYVWLEGGDSLIGSLIGPWSEWRGYVVAAIDTIMDMLTFVGEFIGALAAAMVGAFTLNPALFAEGLLGIARHIESFFSRVGELIYRGVFEPIFSAIRDAFGSAWGPISKFMANAGGVPPAGGLVAPAQMAGVGMGGGTSVRNETNVSVTVPPGTTAEQAAFLKNAASATFAQASGQQLARDMSLYAP